MALSPTWLLQELEDPFLVFPVQSVGRSISTSLKEADENLQIALTNSPAARKYWSAEAEHYFDEIGLLIGAAFVLGQVLIAQTLSIVKQLSQSTSYPGNCPGPQELMKIGSPITMESGLSEMMVVDTSANYFKHYCEWPADWDECKCTRVAARTIRNAKLIGMTPGCRTDNLLLSLGALGLSVTNVEAIADKIQRWREATAFQFRKDSRDA